MIETATAWLASTGAPNWIVLAALLTSPWTWARQVRARLGPALDRVLPTGETKAVVSETPEDDPRE